ncbi:restriction endonuclease subunit S, partial [Caldisericum sp.]|uniref:restriction endonuclease subunit S n=1 Tax=Caldisericum sp. TaxID=2499687 RepID=UPI003D0FB50A
MKADLDMRFYKEEKFKETPIGKTPEDWEVVKLSSIAEIIMGQSPPSSTYNKESVGLPFLQGKLEFGAMYPSPVLYCSKPIKIAKPNDILLSVRAPVGDVNLA